MLRDLSIAWRIIVMVVLGAGIVLGLASLYSYESASGLLERTQEAEIRQTLLATANRIEMVEGNVEREIQGLALSVQDLDADPRSAARLVRRTVYRYDELYGAAVAYDPNDPELYGHVAPYAYMKDGTVRYKDLGSGGAAYEMNDWFQLPYQLADPVWTEPYYSAGGSDVLTATYAVPVSFRGDHGSVSAVVTGDVSLRWLTNTLEGLDLGQTGYAFLISRNGTFIAHPDPAMIMNESIFSVAEARREPSLRAIGRDMTAKRRGFVSFDGLRHLEPDEPSYLVYTPIESTGWSLGIVYARSEVVSGVVALSRLQWGISLVGICALVVVALVVSRSITRPLLLLDRATRTLAQGQLDAPLPKARGRDEIARLTTSFGRMRDDLQEHIEELRRTTAERERIESELRIASSIQMSLVPRTFPPYPERDDLDLFAVLEPAREVGGDFYDFFLLDEDHLCLAVADVSGKGVPAALMMAVGRSFLRSFAREGGGPADILARLNDELSEDNETCMFVTMFLAVVDLRSGSVLYASAGHNRPFVITAGGDVTQLPRIRGMALGAKVGVSYDESALELAAGDVLFLYTDGVSEAMDADGAVFGEDRLGVELGRLRGSCASLLGALLETLRRHADGVEQSDDITMVAFGHLPPDGGRERAGG